MVLNTRLFQHIDAWQRIGAPVTVQSWITNGIHIPFHDDTVPPTFVVDQYPLFPKETQFIRSELSELEALGAVARVNSQPYCVSPLKCAAKKGGKLRLITDLRRLNEHVDPPAFQHESIHTVGQTIRTGDHMVTFDLKNGFFHVPVHPEDQKYLGFQFDNQWYTWKVLPFGLSCSPYFFCKVLRPVIRYLREQRIRLVLYVDDCLVLASADCISDHRDFTVQVFEELGFIINYPKSDLTPSVRKQYIGYIIDSEGPGGQPWLYICARKIRKLKKDIQRVLQAGFVHARFLAKITGQAVAMAKAIIPGKLKLRSLYRLLTLKRSWTDKLPLSEEVAIDLRWWLHAIDQWNGSPLQDFPVEVQIWTDACDTGWGCVCETLEASGTWPVDLVHEHINFKELAAVMMALRSFSSQLQGKSVQIMSDSTTTVAYLNNMGGPSSLLTDLAERIWSVALASGIRLTAKHLAGQDNTWADRLSRLSIQYEWKLHPALFGVLENMWGPHTVDRFASYSTTQLPRYNSRFSDPATSGIDALAQQDWGQENNFVNPPFRMLARVLQVVQDQQAYATVIAPLWPGQHWFQELQQLSVAPAFRIPNSPHVMLRMGDLAEPLKNRRWRLYAWRIYGGQNSSH